MARETKEARRARREAKAARGDFVSNRIFSRHVPKLVGLVRDSNGRPKFDGDPRNLPPDLRSAYADLMSPEEAEEFFGGLIPPRRR